MRPRSAHAPGTGSQVPPTRPLRLELSGRQPRPPTIPCSHHPSFPFRSTLEGALGRAPGGRRVPGRGWRNVRGPINLGTALVVQGRWGDLGRGPKREPYTAAQVLRQQVAEAPGDLGVVVSVTLRAGPASSPLPHWPSGKTEAQFWSAVSFRHRR